MGVTNRQLYFILFMLTLPYAVITISKTMADLFGTGSWIFILGATFIYCFAAGLIAYLSNLFKNMTLFEYSQLLVGKFAAYCLSILYMLNSFIFYTFTARAVSEIIKNEIMPNTPLWVTMIVMIIVSGYAVSKGLTNLGRINEIIGIAVIIIGIIINFLMFCNGDVLNIRPLLNFVEPSKYITAFPSTFYILSGFEMMTIIPFTKRNGKKAISAAMLSVVTVGIFLIIISETCYMVLGIEDTSNYNYPLIAAIRRLDITIFQFLKRIDLIFIIIWIFSVFASSIVYLYGAVEYMRKILAKPDDNRILIAVCIIAFISSLVPRSDVAVNKILTYYCDYFSGFLIFIIPITLLIIAKVKNNEKNITGT